MRSADSQVTRRYVATVRMSSSADFGEPSTASTILESSRIRLVGHSADAGRGSWLILQYKGFGGEVADEVVSWDP